MLNEPKSLDLIYSFHESFCIVFLKSKTSFIITIYVERCWSVQLKGYLSILYTRFLVIKRKKFAITFQQNAWNEDKYKTWWNILLFLGGCSTSFMCLNVSYMFHKVFKAESTRTILIDSHLPEKGIAVYLWSQQNIYNIFI